MNLEGVVAKYALWFAFKALNNPTKYEALLTGLRIAKELKVKKLRTFTNSKLVANQMKGEFEAWDLTITKYLQKVQTLISKFKSFEISYIP